MNRIQVLPPEVVSKIAAGEVIDRPASVLKELLENSLDAGSTQIKIDLGHAGKTLLEITDNGTGIEHDDMDKIFLRHSTSKIVSSDDLFSINSFGFRGEALYSISAVSDIIVRSKTASDDSGWENLHRGGVELGIKPVSMNTGTQIQVKELFFNTPARKKFLKTDAAELTQILNIVIPYTLLKPKVQFILNNNNKTILQCDTQNSFLARATTVLNLDPKQCIQTSSKIEHAKTTIQLILGDINIQRAKKDMQFIFVNNRPVQSRALNFQINQAYRNILPPETHPFFMLFLNVPPQNVDVNIHPAKREVKIGDEHALGLFIRDLCAETLRSGTARQAPLEPPRVKPVEGDVSPEIVNPDGRRFRGLNPGNSPNSTGPLHSSPPAPEGRAGTGAARDILAKGITKSVIPSSLNETRAFLNAHETQTPESKPVQYTFSPSSAQTDNIKEETGTYESAPSMKTTLQHSQYIGCFVKKYLLFETATSLLLVDQHAAHERITFEALKYQLEKGKIEVQQLLAPIILKLTHEEKINWDEGKEKLELLGLSTTQFDQQTIALHTYPLLIKNPEFAVRNLLAGESIGRCDRETLARRACRQSIMTGQQLTKEEAEELRKQLLRCKDPFTCPHGRPTVVEMQEKQIAKYFLR